MTGDKNGELCGGEFLREDFRPWIYQRGGMRVLWEWDDEELCGGELEGSF